MSETPVEDLTGNALQDALILFTGCIGEAFDDICTYGMTIGDTYVPFDPDPDDECGEDDGCSQIWVRIMGADMINVNENSFETGGCAGEMGLSLEVGIMRCLEIPEGGEAPTATQMLEASLQAMDDMNTIYCAAMGCEDAGWASINAGGWSPWGPMGGQYGGFWVFDVVI